MLCIHNYLFVVYDENAAGVVSSKYTCNEAKMLSPNTLASFRSDSFLFKIFPHEGYKTELTIVEITITHVITLHQNGNRLSRN